MYTSCLHDVRSRNEQIKLKQSTCPECQAHMKSIQEIDWNESHYNAYMNMILLFDTI